MYPNQLVKEELHLFSICSLYNIVCNSLYDNIIHKYGILTEMNDEWNLCYLLTEDAKKQQTFMIKHGC